MRLYEVEAEPTQHLRNRYMTADNSSLKHSLQACAGDMTHDDSQVCVCASCSLSSGVKELKAPLKVLYRHHEHVSCATKTCE